MKKSASAPVFPIILSEQPIYGSSRLGVRLGSGLEVRRINYPTTGGPVVVPVFDTTDHLGNVRAVVGSSLKKVGSAVQPTLIASTEYYPFGMSISSLSTNSEKYRYGFNGMEKDDEIKGNGKSYTTEFRQYDPRIGRWLSIDPLDVKYPSMSPYIYCANNPVLLVDPDGQNWYQSVSKEGGNDGSKQKYPTVMWRDGNKSIDGFEDKGETMTGYLPDGSGFAGYADGSSAVNLPEVTFTLDNRPNPSAGIALSDVMQKSVFNAGALAVTLPAAGMSLAYSSISSFFADFSTQMTFNGGKFMDWNITGSFASGLFKNPFMQAAVGSGLSITPSSLLSNGKILNNTVFGNKSISQFLIETGVGGAFNYVGGQAIQNLGIENVPARIGSESWILYLNYLSSSSISNSINKK